MTEYEGLVSKLNNSLKDIRNQNLNQIEKAEQSIKACMIHLDELKQLLVQKGFKSEAEEIRFFKHIKPQMLGQLFHHKFVLKVESGKSLYAHQSLIRYYEKHLAKIEDFAKENDVIVHYYRSGATYLDRKYFKRHKVDFKSIDDPLAFHLDPDLSTYYDQKIGEVLAREHSAQYLTFKINLVLDPSYKEPAAPVSKLLWTGSKVSLVELAYALFCAKCINNGNADISDIAEGLERLFNADLRDFYRKFQEIKARKFRPTKFLDSLRDYLAFRIAEDDS